MIHHSDKGSQYVSLAYSQALITAESINAHLTIVFAALAIARWLETRTKVSIRHLVNTLCRSAPSPSKPATTSSPPKTPSPKHH